MCKLVPNINRTLLPSLVLPFSIDTLKVESPDTNPANQKGFGIPLNLYLGLFTGTIQGKAFFNSSERPLFRLYFNAKICSKPSCVKCFFLLN